MNLELKNRHLVWFLLTLILLLGVVLRGIYLSEIRGNPDFAFPSIDASYHDYWARGLVGGVWAVPEGREDPQIYRYPFYRPPGYAYFLASIYWVFGPNYLWPRIFQMAVGVGVAFLVFSFSRKWFGEAVGLIAALLVSTYWILIYFEGELVGVVFAAFLSLLLVSLLARLPGRLGPWWGGLCGVVAGGYALLRPNVLLFLPVTVLWIIWAVRRRGAGKWLPAVAGLFLGTVAAILPVTARNYLVSGEVVPIATNAGISAIVANNPLSDGTTHTFPGLGDVGTPYDYPRIVRHLERQLGRPLSHSEASNYLVGRAIEFAKENPGRFIYLLGRKALLFWGPREIRNLKEVHFARLHSPLLRKIPGNFPFVVAIFIVGVILVFLDIRRAPKFNGNGRACSGGGPSKLGHYNSAKRRDGEFETVVLTLLFVGAYFLSLLPFAAAARYRVPIIPFLLIFGAYGLVRIGKFAWKQEWKRAVLWAMAAAALYGLASINFSGFRPSPEKWHFDRALAYTDKKDWENAIRCYRAAIEFQPGFVRAINNLGNIYALREDYDEAIKYYRLVIRLQPDVVQARNNLGNAYFKQGKLEEALEEFKEALRIRPDLVEAQNNLGVCFLQLGRIDDAIEHYRKAIEYKPSNVASHVNLAKALVRQGKYEEAYDHLATALRLQPGFPQAARIMEALKRRMGGR